MRKKPDSRNKKYYYGAVFSFVCAAAVVAGVGAFHSKDNGRKVPDRSAQGMEEEYETQTVDSNKNAQPKIFDETAVENEVSRDYGEEADAPAAANQTKPNAEIKNDDKAVPEDKTSKENTEEDSNAEDLEETAALEDDLKLQWPIEGTIVMDYSTDQAIYDITLDQFRTNDNVCIGAEAGTAVKASADGTVESVSFDAQRGNTVVLDHGDGWKTTYSQLMEDVSVNVGDRVTAGETIGQVAAPTKYSVLLGDHLEFKVTRDDSTVDPKVALMD